MQAAATQDTVTPLGLPRVLFWDTNPDNVDLEKHAGTVMARVMEYGRMEDWRKMRAYYGDERIVSVVTKLRDLHPQVVSLCCAVFDLTKEDFRCCTAKPFPPAPWIY